MSTLLVTNLECFLGFSLPQTIDLLEDHVCMGVSVTKSSLICPFLLTSIYVTYLKLFPLLL